MRQSVHCSEYNLSYVLSALAEFVNSTIIEQLEVLDLVYSVCTSTSYYC